MNTEERVVSSPERRRPGHTDIFGSDPNQSGRKERAMTDTSSSSPVTERPGMFREFAAATMLRMLFHDRTTTKDTMEPIVKTHYAAILFADISGFTRLSASLSEEKLRLHINNYFSKIINVIQEHNGDVVKFCGDALMIIWPVDKAASPAVQAVTVQMATGCGLHLLHDSAAWNNSLEFSQSVSSPAQRLGLHCGVASGPLHCMCVGENDRWEFLVSGSVVDEVGVACSEAKNGELCLSTDAHKLVQDSINCVPRAHGCFKVDQSGGIFAHIPRHDGKNKLHRTWSSYPEVGQTFGSPKSPEVASPEKRKGHQQNHSEELSVSPGSSILTFNSSPNKPSQNRNSDAKSNGASAKDLLEMRSPSKKQTNSEADLSQRKSVGALSVLRESFSTSPMKEPMRGKLGVACGSQLSITSLSREPSSSSTPRYLSLDDLKAQRETHRQESSLSNSLDDSREMSAPATFQSSSNNFDTPMSLGSMIRPKITIPPQLGLESDVFTNIRNVVSPSVRSGHSNPSSTGHPSSLKKDISVKTIDEDLEDEGIFMRVEVDSNMSSESSSLGDVELFYEPEDEHVMVAKNFLTGYLRTDGAPSLYEFEGMNQVLRCFAQEPARKSVEHGLTSLLAELRVVVTMFIEVIGLEKDFQKGSIRRPQMVLRFMLACLRHFGGGLRQYIVDDKGCVLICGFGLPGFSHVDNCARAVETAVAMKRLLQASKLDCRIGIAEGRVYCGLVGSTDRCEYAMMGKSVNLAARMMGKSKPGQITVGEEVYSRTTDKFVYSIMPKIRAKGYNKPIAVFCPVERVQLHNGFSGSSENASGSRKVQEFIGREHEIEFFDSALGSFAHHAMKGKDTDNLESPFCYMIEGDIGMGKTWLVGEICYIASQYLEIENILIATAESPQSYSATQYDTIRQLLIQIFGLNSGSDVDTSVDNPSLSPQYVASDLRPIYFEVDAPSSPPQASPHSSLDRRSPPPVVSGLPSLSAAVNLLNRPTGSARLSSVDAIKQSDSTSRPGSIGRAGMMQSHSGKSSKFSLSSDTTVDINAFFSAAQLQLSPPGGDRFSIRQRPNMASSSNDDQPTKQQKLVERVMNWADENIGPDDVLTARISAYDLTQIQPALNVDVQRSLLTRDQGSSSGFDSFESSTSNGEDQTSTSDLVSERSLDPTGSTRPGKMVTRRVLQMLPLLNGLLGIKIPVTEEVTKLTKDDALIMLNVLLIFIVTRTIEKSKSLLVVEHLQWCDHYSMYIILQSLKIAKSDVFFVGTQRSTSGIKHKSDKGGKRSKYLAELAYCCSHHVLYPFTLDEIKATLESALGPIFNMSNPEIMSNHNLSTILDRSDGSPLLVSCLCFEIANAIKEGTFIDIESLPCGRRDDLIDMFDQILGHSDQLVLKVASVIGRSFTFQEMCFLLVMLGLSEFIVDLEAALQRMMESGFIEEYHVEANTEALTVGNIPVDTAGGIHPSSSSKLQHLLRYRFTNNSVHENVYNLMLEEHREVAHTFLGAYLEPYLVQKPALFDRAVFHFIRSGNVSKKIEYLCKAAEVSRIAGNIRDVYFYFGELVKLSTGLKVQDLLAFCLISVEQVVRSPEDMKSCILRRVHKVKHMHDFPPYVCLGRRWISGGEFCTPVYSLVEEISVENVCRWIGEMGIILFKLGSLQASANLIKLALHGMDLPVSMAPDISNRSVGSLVGASSVKVARVSAGDTLSESAFPARKNGKSRVWKSISSVFSSKVSKTSSIMNGLPDNIPALKLSMSLYEHLTMINLLHGSVSVTLQHLKHCGDIKEKICHILSVGIQYRRDSAVSFVDQIIDPDEVLEFEEETKQRFFNDSVLTTTGQSLRAMAHHAVGARRVEQKVKQPNDLKAVAEGDSEADILGDVLQSPSSLGDNTSAVYSLSSVAYDQTTPGASPEPLSTTPNTCDLKGKYIAHNGQNFSLVFEKAISLVEKAVIDSAVAKFETCLLYMRRGASLLGCLSDEVGGTMRQFLHLFQAWCSFISGHGSKSKVLLEVISKVVSVYEQATLFKWAVELRALKLVLGPSDSSNCLAVHELMKQLKEILKSDKPTACSSAIMAIFHACNRDPIEAVKSARYAMLKLIPREAVTFVAPLFLFLAGYAAAIAMELYATAMMSTDHDDNSVLLVSLPSRSHSADSDTGAASQSHKVGWVADAQKKSYDALRRFEMAEECVSLVQQRLKTLYKTSQPCVVSLYRALKIKRMLCNAVLYKTVQKLPFAKLTSGVKTAPFSDFTFGDAFLRLEQLNLCVVYYAEKHSSKEYALTRDAEFREVVQLFGKLGSPSYKLYDFGLFRFSSASVMPAGMSALGQMRSQSSLHSDGSSSRIESTPIDNPEDLRRVSRLVTQYRPVNVDQKMGPS